MDNKSIKNYIEKIDFSKTLKAWLPRNRQNKTIFCKNVKMLLIRPNKPIYYLLNNNNNNNSNNKFIFCQSMHKIAEIDQKQETNKI